MRIISLYYFAPVAQLDRVPGYEPGGQRFKSSPVHSFIYHIMIVRTFPTGPIATNAYLLVCPITRKAAIIDPGLQSAGILNKVLHKEGWTPEILLLTHTHWDHIGNVADLKAEWNLPVWVHALDAENLRHPGSDGLPLWVSIEGVEPDGFLEEGQTLTFGQQQLKVIHTPGHTPGGVCFYHADDGLLISGDTLFKGSIGNLSFTTGQPERMWPSLKKLAALPPETRVFPGHGPSTTIGEEKWLSDAENIFGNS